MDPAVSQYVIGADVPPLRAPKSKVILYRFGFCFFGYAGLLWLTNLWSHHESLLGIVLRSLIFALLMALLGASSSQGTESVLIVTDDYIERKYLSSVGTTIINRKIARNQIKSVSEVYRRFRPFPFRRRKGLMIKEGMMSSWFGASIFVPGTAPDYDAIKAKLSSWVAPKRLAE